MTGALHDQPACEITNLQLPDRLDFFVSRGDCSVEFNAMNPMQWIQCNASKCHVSNVWASHHCMSLSTWLDQVENYRARYLPPLRCMSYQMSCLSWYQQDVNCRVCRWVTHCRLFVHDSRSFCSFCLHWLSRSMCMQSLLKSEGRLRGSNFMVCFCWVWNHKNALTTAGDCWQQCWLDVVKSLKLSSFIGAVDWLGAETWCATAYKLQKLQRQQWHLLWQFLQQEF